jgi:hypothetical protein
MQKIPGLGNRSRSAIRFSLWAFHSFKRGKENRVGKENTNYLLTVLSEQGESKFY